MAYFLFLGQFFYYTKGGVSPILFFYWDVKMKKEVEYLTFVEM